MFRSIFRFGLVLLLVGCGSVGAVAATAPTLTSVNTLTGAMEDQAFVITNAMLLAAADEFDLDGDQVLFRIQSIATGTTLMMRNAPPLAPGTPSTVTPGTLLGATKELVWTPPANAFNSQPAFTVRAWDGALSSPVDVQVTVQVTGVPDLPTLTSISTLNIGTEDTRTIITRATVLANSNATDADGQTVNFKVMSVVSGTLGYRAINTNNALTPAVAGTPLNATNELVWDPAPNANGLQGVCTLVATSADGESSPPVQVNVQVAPVNDTVLTDPFTVNLEYSLKINGFALLLAGSLTVTDADGQPVLYQSGKGLTITGTINQNRYQREDELVVRNTAECKVDPTGNGTWDIFARAKPSVKLATVSVNPGTGVLTLTVDAAADSYASSGSPTRIQILTWLLQCIAYTNNAGLFAQRSDLKRQATLLIREADTPTDARAIVANITLLTSNEKPRRPEFEPVVVSPGGTRAIALKAIDEKDQKIDDQTPNDQLRFTLTSLPENGELVDLATNQVITSFLGSRLNTVDPPRASGIGYRNKDPNVFLDTIHLTVEDAGGLKEETSIPVVIAFDSGDARIISDPVVTASVNPLLTQANQTKIVHVLQLAGPTGKPGTLTLGSLSGFTPFKAADASLSSTTSIPGTDGKASAILTITPPVGREYLAFTLTWAFDANNRVVQPFIIRLVSVPVMVLQASN